MKKVLLVVDMQRDFIDGALGTENCQSAVDGCVKLCEDLSFDLIIFTKDTHYPDYLNTFEGKRLPIKHCVFGTPGWEIIPELEKYASNEDNICKRSCVVCKNTFGTIDGVSDLILNELGDGVYVYDDFEIHVCGVCTSICVLSNIAILRARFPDKRIILHRSATGDVTPENKQSAIVCAAAIQCDIED